MRTSVMVLASLLLLLVLATTAHGIRFDRQLHEALNKKQELAGDSKSGQPPNGAADPSSSKHCTPDGSCSGKATKPPSPHAHAESDDASAEHQIPPKRNHDGDAQSRHEAAAVTSTSHGGQQTWSRRTLPRRPQQPQKETRTYPDLIDIAGMDYSPAARKPPIHN